MHRLLTLLTAAALACAVNSAQADAERLDKVLASQPEEVQARYVYRHPKETLTFLGIEPGMTVAEVLPGGGWYTKILLPYLGKGGHLIGVDYALDMYPLFGQVPEEVLEAKKTWAATWTAQAEEWRTEDSASVSAFAFGSMPDAVKGTADAIVLIRALHNINRFEAQGGYLTAAMRDAYAVLKPGGIAGVVQHMAPAGKTDEWADGSRGYLKKDHLIRKMQQAGFEFVAESDINVNPKDQPGDDDPVWRLPPSLGTSKDNPELAAKMNAIGESTRMTLKFRKP